MESTGVCMDKSWQIKTIPSSQICFDLLPPSMKPTELSFPELDAGTTAGTLDNSGKNPWLPIQIVPDCPSPSSKNVWTPPRWTRGSHLDSWALWKVIQVTFLTFLTVLNTMILGDEDP